MDAADETGRIFPNRDDHGFTSLHWLNLAGATPATSAEAFSAATYDAMCGVAVPTGWRVSRTNYIQNNLFSRG